MSSPKKNDILYVLVAAALGTAFALMAGCKKKEIGPIIEFPAPIGTPGGIGMINGKITYQDIANLRVITNCKAELNKKKLVSRDPPRMVGIWNPVTDERKRILDHPGVQLAPLPQSFGKGIFLWSSDGVGIAMFESLNISLPRGAFPPRGVSAVAFDGRGICAIGPTETRYMPRPWSEWKVGPPVIRGEPVQFSGLVYLPRTKTYLTMLSSNGEGVEFKLSGKATPRIVRKYPPVTDYPFDMEYDPLSDVLWMTNPERRSIFRVEFKYLRGLQFPPVSDHLPRARKISGEITANASWKQGNIVVKSTITIKRGATLAIEPGAHVYFGPQAALVVEGKLNVGGEAGKTVVLDSLEPADFWKGIIVKTGGEVLLERCELKRARTAVNALSPASMKIYQAEFHNIAGTALRIRGPLEESASLVIGNNSFEGIGARAISIEESGGAIAKRTNILGNYFHKVGSATAVNIGSPEETAAPPSVEIAGNIVEFSRRTAFDIEGGVHSDLDVKFKDNVVLQGSELGDCLAVRNASAVSVERNYFKNCGGACIELRGTPGKIEGNVFELSRAGLIVSGLRGELAVINNESRRVDVSVGARKNPRGLPDAALILDGNLWGKAFLAAAEPSRICLGSMGKKVVNRGDASQSRAPAFFCATVISALTAKPIPNHEFSITAAALKSPLKIQANAAGMYAGSFPAGNYRFYTKNALRSQFAVLEKGNLADLQLLAP